MSKPVGARRRHSPGVNDPGRSSKGILSEEATILSPTPVQREWKDGRPVWILVVFAVSLVWYQQEWGLLGSKNVPRVVESKRERLFLQVDRTSSNRTAFSLSVWPNHQPILDKDEEATFYQVYWVLIQDLSKTMSLIQWPLHPTNNHFLVFSSRPHLASVTTRAGLSPEETKLAWRKVNASHPWIYGIGTQISLCQVARQFASLEQKPQHVMMLYFNENVGAFSPVVPNRTRVMFPGQGSLANIWAERNGNCTRNEVLEYLNAPETKAVVTMQHHAMDHPKVHSLPIGWKKTTWTLFEKHFLSSMTTLKKTQWLMINDSGYRWRYDLTQRVIKNFAADGMVVKNTYCRTGHWRNKKNKTISCPPNQSMLYLQELIRSRFILCPSGLGWDSYRIWEALTVGTIPIVERYGRKEDGWRRTLENLPVLWVDRMEDVNWKMLQEWYPKLIGGGVARVDSYRPDKLTTFYWMDIIEKLAQDP